MVKSLVILKNKIPNRVNAYMDTPRSKVNKKISIIVATFNSGKTISKCLESIVNQKIPEVELVVIDGGSSDNTLSIIKSYSDFIDYFISEQDSGIYDAWNKGLLASNGEWVSFVGSDDYLIEGALSSYLELVPNLGDVDYISSAVNLVNDREEVIGKIDGAFDWRVFRNYMNVAHVASLHSKQLFKDVGFFDTSFKICGDYELLLRKGKELKAYYHDRKVANMTVGGISHNSFESLSEALEAKIKNKSRPLLFCYLDYYLATVKLAARIRLTK